MQIACITDGVFARHTGAMLHSALSHAGPGCDVHVLCGVPPAEPDVAALTAVAARFSAHLKIRNIAPERATPFPDGYFPRAVWFRILLPELLPEVDKVLYLDSDVIVTDALAPLWNTELGDQLLGAVVNPFYPFMPPHPQKLGLKPAQYFNSGVLLMNLRRMRAEDFIARIYAFARAHPAAPYPDQDALNVACRDRWLSLPPRWNLQSTFYELSPEQLPAPPEAIREARARPAIIHFIGPFKPWHFLCRHPEQHRYFQHARRTPWGEPPIEGRSLTNAVLRLLPLAWIDRWFALQRRMRTVRTRTA